MLILSVDTTTRAGSVGVLRNGVILSEISGDPEVTHGQRLPGALMRALEAAGAGIEDVELFAVAAGPGSFTGLRVGIATVQGLAMARSRRVVPVSVLDALARAAANANGPVAAWMDAQRGEVFSALYAPDGAGTLIAAESSPPDLVLDSWLRRPDFRTPVFIGDGAVRYRREILGRLGDSVRVLPAPPLAGLIGQIAAGSPERAVLPHAVVPIYVRKSDAELARARRAPAG